MTNEVQPPPPPDEDDEGWDDYAVDAFFDALAGRVPKTETADAKAQAIFGSMMRDAFQRTEVPLEDIPEDPEATERLMARLREKGLFKDVPKP